MRSKIAFKLLALLLFIMPAFGGSEPDPIYTPKVFFDTTQAVKSLKRYDKNTAKFLEKVEILLREKLLGYLTREGVYLLLKDGIGSDLTVFYTFPRAEVQSLVLKEETDTGWRYRFGYRIDLDLALYVFRTSPNPKMVFYKVYNFQKYHPPSGEYLPVSTTLAEVIATNLFLRVERDLDKVLEEEKKRLEYYRNLGK